MTSLKDYLSVMEFITDKFPYHNTVPLDKGHLYIPPEIDIRGTSWIESAHQGIVVMTQVPYFLPLDTRTSPIGMCVYSKPNNDMVIICSQHTPFCGFDQLMVKATDVFINVRDY